MKNSDQNSSNEVVRGQEKLFTLSVRRQMRLRKVKELLGSTLGQSCLEISAGDGFLSGQLRLDGGIWTSLVSSPAAQSALGFFVKDNVRILQNELIDEPDQSFDAVVIMDSLERIQDDHAFIRECHRVLKTDGRLIISVARKPLFCLGSCSLRSLLGLSWKKKGWARPGYTPREFFDVLKDGFDVPETIAYSSCLLELPGLLCEASANGVARGPYTMPTVGANTDFYKPLIAMGSLIYPLMWVLASLENARLSVMPGNNLVAKTKRRFWRERRIPVLVDGRSITEATLNAKIGTAAPF